MTSERAAAEIQRDVAAFAGVESVLTGPRSAAWEAMPDGMDFVFTRVQEPTREATLDAVWAGVRDVVTETTGVVRGDP